MFVDTHCHLDYIERQVILNADLPSAETAWALAKSQGVTALINPGTELATMPDVLQMAERFDGVYAALAIHPTDVEPLREIPNWQEQLSARLEHPKVVAVGETGLDYYHNNEPEHIAWQHSCFRHTLDLAKQHTLPVIIHDRDAHADILRIVQEQGVTRGVMHCFSGDIDFAHAMIAQGFYISFAGNLTFKKAFNLHQAATELPLDKLLIETDSPFLSPVPHRGKPNHPANVVHVAQWIAQARGVSLAVIAEATTHNAKSLFQLV